MAGHTSEKRWDRNRFGDSGIGLLIRDASVEAVDKLTSAENLYQDLIELWTYAGGTDQLVADQLFFEVWSVRVSDPIGAPGVVDTEANTVEVGQVADAKAAALAFHELYQALTNVAVVTKDRVTTLRRMT